MADRMPIYLHKNAVALITIFKRVDHLEDIWVADYPDYDEDYDKINKEAARQFIDQMEGQWTPRFLIALKSEIEKRLRD